MNQRFLRISKRLLFRCSAAYAELTLICRSAVGAGPAACVCLLRITLLRHLSRITLLRVTLLGHLSGIALLRITLLGHLSGVALLRITLLRHSGSCHTTGGRHTGHAAYGSHTGIRAHAHAGSRHGTRVTQIHQRSADVFRNRHIFLIIRRIHGAGIVRVHAALNSVDNSA